MFSHLFISVIFIFFCNVVSLPSSIGKVETRAKQLSLAFGVRRGPFASLMDRDSTRFWQRWLRGASRDFTGSLRKSLSDPELWRFWTLLHSSTQARVISQLTPLLVGGKDWRLHCSDAYSLCLADSNCRLKLWNFMSSCSPQKMPFEDWPALRWESSLFFPRIRIRRVSAKRPNLKRQSKFRRNRRFRKRRRKWKNKTRSSANLGKLHSQSRLRKAWKDATQDLHYWMGKYWPNIYRNPSFEGPECSPRCLNALLMLNETVYASLLAKCDCAAKPNDTQNPSAVWDEAMCNRNQAKALECRPRLFRPRKGVIGCTESRLKCENDPKCEKAQANFLLKCSQVISGVTCTEGCMDAKSRLAEASRHFSTCVCDGSEKRECRRIRSNLNQLCTSKKIDNYHIQNSNDGNNIVRRTQKSISNYKNAAILT